MKILKCDKCSSPGDCFTLTEKERLGQQNRKSGRFLLRVNKDLWIIARSKKNRWKGPTVDYGPITQDAKLEHAKAMGLPNVTRIQVTCRVCLESEWKVARDRVPEPEVRETSLIERLFEKITDPQRKALHRLRFNAVNEFIEELERRDKDDVVDVTPAAKPLRGRRRPPRVALKEYAQALDRLIKRFHRKESQAWRVRKMASEVVEANPYIHPDATPRWVEDRFVFPGDFRPVLNIPLLLDRIRKLLRAPD